ncbi:MAG: cysteine desulfurase family protein [Bacteroidota bacterium]|nr:cysteine desulfurase family protein [Bacteroidota bacterium]MDP3145650.1 cysteine desulfurase family protein [Bacteroidota bacterium]MDP3558675.1 cysteine desulfurase family protein [Bacteroidota bacterium]
MKVYLDNAATTKLDETVLKTMMPLMLEDFGNPSSIHAFGRKTRAEIEKARKTVAKLLNVTPAEIFFTSGGTEADNMAINQSITTYDIKHVISSVIEHHAVETTLKMLENAGKIKVSWVKLDKKGNVDLADLEELLKNNSRSLVSLMHANNELGTLLPLKEVGEICEKYNAIFHSDTVQTMGHYKMDLRDIKVHFVTCAAHKFHGPKGVGFLYINHLSKISPFIYGGAQERNMRGGTENVYGIVGLAKALEICFDEMEQHQKHIMEIKDYMREQLIKNIPGVDFNGETAHEKSLYTVLNCCFPNHPDAEMLLFNLDILGIAASGGSACSSGSNQGSHVLRGIGADMERPSVRFSFSKYTTKEEIDFVLKNLIDLFKNQEK